MSAKNKYFGNADFIFSQDALRTAHTYYLVVNDQPKNPRVVRVIKEIIKKQKS